MTGSTKEESPPATADAPEKTILILDYDGTLHDSMGIYEPAILLSDVPMVSERRKSWQGLTSV